MIKILLRIVLVPAFCLSWSVLADEIVARVNSEVIYGSVLMDNMPEDQFSCSEESLRSIKLNRLIGETIIRQFLRGSKIDVSEQEIDHGITELKWNPPSAGCMCCRYPDLQRFMDVNAFSMDELRMKTSNEIGLQKYLLQQWEKSTCRKPATNGREIRRIRRDYLKIRHIFFNTFQLVRLGGDPNRIDAMEKNKAEKAMEELRNGASFSNVALKWSEDSFSRDHGGLLGNIPADLFGLDIRKKVSSLKPGETSVIVRSIWGYHIMRNEIIDIQDIIAVLQQEFMDTQRKKLLQSLNKKAFIEYAEN